MRVLLRPLAVQGSRGEDKQKKDLAFNTLRHSLLESSHSQSVPISTLINHHFSTMFTRSITNTFTFLLKTPLVPQGTGPQAVELATITRPRAASRTLSAYSVRGYASGKGKKELYSDEAGSVGAGVSASLAGV